MALWQNEPFRKYIAAENGKSVQLFYYFPVASGSLKDCLYRTPLYFVFFMFRHALRTGVPSRCVYFCFFSCSEDDKTNRISMYVYSARFVMVWMGTEQATTLLDMYGLCLAYIL